ncbi:hypothetical protein [Chitinophaga sp. RAB17]|uniref:hypothetical protein n=1 Tax=Chitinophaga sp. RAB17 TaxID=3233049 RepID=UPI003F8DEAEA
MSGKAEVLGFLQAFKVNLDIWGVIFRSDRNKNIQALLDLDIRPDDRIDVLKSLELTDYSTGPLEERLNGGASMWIFGKEVKKKEVYIKITMGTIQTAVICISFHLAEFKMKYPFK